MNVPYPVIYRNPYIIRSAESASHRRERLSGRKITNKNRQTEKGDCFGTLTFGNNPQFWFCEERNSVLFLFSHFLAALLHCFALLAIFASLDFFATLLLGFVANLLTFFSLSFFAARFLHGFLCSYVEGENTHAQKEHKLFHDVSVFSVMECVSYRKVEAPLYLV